ncbi:MAG TPA: metal-sensitive transcriptional regulator [Patescibacteria group bacterium]|nr:metal-sensitive transcriptional regulator [Patescibacteria group bacterium]
MDCHDENNDHKKDLLNRLARAEGHLKKVKQMAQDDAYCIDVITQSLAVQAALRSIDEVVLKNHLQTCVKDAMISKKGVDKKIGEIITTLKFMRK